VHGTGGRMIPGHGPRGEEWTLAVKVAYEAGGRRFEAGALEMADATVHHAPGLNPDEECICLVRTSGRIRPKRVIVRMIQPFIGRSGRKWGWKSPGAAR
jgi:putative transcriptional regulator